MSGVVAALLVAGGAAVGAPVRYVAGRAWDDRVPWGTALVNVAGSFLLGLFTALALSGATMALLGTGFCGALTTYSSFVVQAHDRGPRLGTAYAVGTLALSLAACWLGFLLGG